MGLFFTPTLNEFLLLEGFIVPSIPHLSWQCNVVVIFSSKNVTFLWVATELMWLIFSHNSRVFSLAAAGFIVHICHANFPLSPLSIIVYTVYHFTVNCTLNYIMKPCTLNTVHWTLNNTHYTLHNTHCTLHTPRVEIPCLILGDSWAVFAIGDYWWRAVQYNLVWSFLVQCSIL